MSSRRVRERAVRRPGNFRGRAAHGRRGGGERVRAHARCKFSVRPKAVIDRDVAARFSEPDAPAPARRLIGEAGKLRFQRQREFNGVLPEENPALRAPPRRPRGRDDPAAEARALERAFDDVAEELEAFEEDCGRAEAARARSPPCAPRSATESRRSGNWTKASRARGPRRTGRSDGGRPGEEAKRRVPRRFFLPRPGRRFKKPRHARKKPTRGLARRAHVPASDQRRGRIVREVQRERQAQLLVVRQVPHTGSILLANVPEGGLEGAKVACGAKNPKAVAHGSVAAGGLAGGWALRMSKPGDRCARCLGHCNDGSCRVPHPAMDRDLKGCPSAVMATWKPSTAARSDEMARAHGGQNLLSGPRYCYEGEHTKARRAKGDARRVQPFTVHITQSSSLQAEIDAVPKDRVSRRHQRDR